MRLRQVAVVRMIRSYSGPSRSLRNIPAFSVARSLSPLRVGLCAYLSLFIFLCLFFHNSKVRTTEIVSNIHLHTYERVSSQRQCRNRDVSSYSNSTVQHPIKDATDDGQRWNSCLQYRCDWNTNHTHCDSFGPTIYNDPFNPPCCVHILRDMAAAFDAVMCKLGFEYFSSYGMLLGLVRNDKLIPWTSDNDYIATDRTLAAMYDMSPTDKKVWDDHGIHFFFDNHFHRVCVTTTFMKGELAKSWKTKSYNWNWYPLVYPYADIFVARETFVNNTSVMIDELGCAHQMEIIRPAQRRGVYQNSFQVSMPNNAEEVVKRVYGSSWRIPDAKKTPHGDTKCG